MKKMLLTATLVAILFPVMADARPLCRLASRGKSALGKVVKCVGGRCG